LVFKSALGLASDLILLHFLFLFFCCSEFRYASVAALFIFIFLQNCLSNQNSNPWKKSIYNSFLKRKIKFKFLVPRWIGANKWQKK
jgi:hypothetical protein